MMCNYMTVFLVLLFGAWTKAEEGQDGQDTQSRQQLENYIVVAPCDPQLVRKVKEYKEKKLAEDEKLDYTQFMANCPWRVVSATCIENQVKSIEFAANEIEIYTTGGQESKGLKKEMVKVVEWEKLITAERNSDLHLHVWKFQPVALVFGYYLCKSGETVEGETRPQPHFGIAASLASGGGMPSEAKDEIDLMKTQVDTVFGIKDVRFTELSLQ